MIDDLADEGGEVNIDDRGLIVEVLVNDGVVVAKDSVEIAFWFEASLAESAEK